jgi:hypothetical protein
MEPKFAKVHDMFIARYLRTNIKRIIGERRTNIYGKRQNGELFKIVLKVHEYIQDAGERVFIGVVRDVSLGNRDEDYLALLEKVLQCCFFFHSTISLLMHSKRFYLLKLYRNWSAKDMQKRLLKNFVLR